MNVELTECYKVLGLGPGASSAELKSAHRDLTKVWHPDRFLHDPRLQQKAQEKLKEINEAYDQLRSGKAKRRTPPPASAREYHPRTHSQSVNVGMAHRIRWRLILAPVLIFAVTFLIAVRSLLRPGGRFDQNPIPAFSETQDRREQPQSANGVINSSNELLREKDRTDAKSREDLGDALTSQPNAASLPKMPTVTILIDPTTGMIARANCPVKSAMTYPSGNEPHQYCTAHPAAPRYEDPGPGELRIKSTVKRLASPDKWFSGKPKSEAGNKQDTKSP